MKDYKIQSILFNKKLFNKSSAIKWLFDHNFSYIKTHETKNYLRMRQLDPAMLKSEGYNKYMAIDDFNDGVVLVIAYKK